MQEPSPASNEFGVGNPHASRVQKLRGAMLAAITEADIEAIVAKLIDMSRDGSLPAMKLLFDLIGKPVDGAVMPSEPAGDKAERIQQIAARIRLKCEAESA